MGQQKKTVMRCALINIPVRLEVATDDESGFRTVCTNGGKHDPVRVKQHVDCPSCGKTAPSTWGYPERAREADGQLALVTQDEIKAAAGEPKNDMDLTLHPREKVYAATLSADSVQNIYPQGGYEKQYRALATMLREHPELVACTVWAPKTKNALWTIETVDGRLVAQKRCWPEDVRPTEAIPMAGEMSDAERAMFEIVIAGATEDFDLEKYRDNARAGVNALLAEKGVTFNTPTSEGAGAPDMLAALRASVEALKASPKATRKPPAKKTAAKKTAAKKTAKKAPAKKGVAA